MIVLHLKAETEFCVTAIVGFVLFVCHFSRLGSYFLSFPLKGLKNRDCLSERSRKETIKYARALL